jgi:hypothetical protein
MTSPASWSSADLQTTHSICNRHADFVRYRHAIDRGSGAECLGQTLGYPDAERSGLLDMPERESTKSLLSVGPAAADSL